MAKQVLSLIIELNDGNKLDWYALTRDQRRMMKSKVPWLAAKVKEYEREMKINEAAKAKV